MVELPDNSINALSTSSSPLTGEGIVIDIGTGDGRYVYNCARQNPKKFYIGIDPNPRPLEKISEKIHRKPAKGGLPNVLFVQSSLEDLPSELNGVADEVHVHFPWGSLLRAVATGDPASLRNLRRICAPEAILEVVLALDPERDQSEFKRLKLGAVSIAYIDTTLATAYREAGFEIIERGTLNQKDWPKLESSWARRLKGGRNRSLVYVIAHAIDIDSSDEPSREAAEDL